MSQFFFHRALLSRINVRNLTWLPLVRENGKKRDMKKHPYFSQENAPIRYFMILSCHKNGYNHDHNNYHIMKIYDIFIEKSPQSKEKFPRNNASKRHFHNQIGRFWIEIVGGYFLSKYTFWNIDYRFSDRKWSKVFEYHKIILWYPGATSIKHQFLDDGNFEFQGLMSAFRKVVFKRENVEWNFGRRKNIIHF